MKEELAKIREELAKIVELEIQSHATTLAIKQQQAIYTDDYGNKITKKWEEECDYFLEKNIYPLIYAAILKSYPSFLENDNRKEFDHKLIEDICPNVNLIKEFDFTESLPTIEGNDQFKEDMSGEEYEAFCSKKLQECGWETNQTLKSNDQGVDIVAVKNGIRLCVQCKRYSSPVGNSAVQEEVAGMGFYKGTRSAVISNAGFTQQAESLARSNNVLLLSHLQISILDDLLLENNTKIIE